MNPVLPSNHYWPEPHRFDVPPVLSTSFPGFYRQTSQHTGVKADTGQTGVRIGAPLPSPAGVGWIQGTIPVQPVTTAESHPSRRFRELLRAKIAAEQQRPPEPREPLALNITQYALDLATHKAGDTVFNPSFAGKHYSTAPEPQKLGPYNMNGGPSFRAPSFSQSRETRAYTPTSYPGDDTFTSTTQDSFNTLAFTGAFLTNHVPPNSQHTFERPQSDLNTCRNVSNDLSYWAPPVATTEPPAIPYQLLVQTKFANQQNMSLPPSQNEADCSNWQATNPWCPTTVVKPSPPSAQQLSELNRPNPFDAFFNLNPFVSNIRLDHLQTTLESFAPSQPTNDLPQLTGSDTTNSGTPVPHPLITPILPVHASFSSPPQPVQIPTPLDKPFRSAHRDSRDCLEPPPVSPTASTSSRASMDRNNSVHSYRTSMYASMNGVVQDASGGSYNAATGGGLNGGSASRYENMGSSASGSGYGGGGDDANGDGSGGGMDRHGGGGDGDGDGDGDGEDNEEQRRQKKLTLACHFCRRRKLKCDGHRPTCENCAKRNEVCTFDEAVRRRGPGKRTKEMRDRAAREADAAGLTNASSAGAILSPVPGPAQLTGPGLGQGPDPGLDPSQGSGPSTLAELEVKKGKKRKSEGASDGEKKPKYENSDFEGDQGYL